MAVKLTRHVAARRGRAAAVGGRGDGLLGERHRRRRAVSRSLLLPQEAAVLGAARLGRAAGGAAHGLPAARGARWPLLLVAGDAARARAGAAVRRSPSTGRGAGSGSGSVSFQPAELAKLALVVYLAAFLARRREALGDFRRGLLPPLLVAAGARRAGPGAAGPRQLPDADRGDVRAPVPGRVRAVRYLAGRGRPRCRCWRWRSGSRPTGCVASPTFLDPWSDPRGGGFQIIQSWLALGIGRPARAGDRRVAPEALLPARGAHRLHLRRRRRGAGLHRRPVGVRRAVRRADLAGAARRACARRSRSAPTWRSASRCSSPRRRWSTSAWSRGCCRPRACRCRSSRSAARPCS